MKKRHGTYEQLLFLILAYSVGFATAFFGLFDESASDKHAQLPSFEGAASVQSAFAAGAQTITDTTQNQRGFYAVINGNERIISAAGMSRDGMPAGYHYAIYAVSVSPGRDRVFYCAQHWPSDQECRGYVYDAETDTINFVRADDGTHLTFGYEELDARWTESGELVVDSVRSSSAAAPWRVE